MNDAVSTHLRWAPDIIFPPHYWAQEELFANVYWITQRCITKSHIRNSVSKLTEYELHLQCPNRCRHVYSFHGVPLRFIAWREWHGVDIFMMSNPYIFATSLLGPGRILNTNECTYMTSNHAARKSSNRVCYICTVPSSVTRRWPERVYKQPLCP